MQPLERPANPGEIFDFHAHYDDAAFDPDRDEVLRELPDFGVCGVLNCGVDLSSSRACIALAERYAYCYAAAGYHPENLDGSPLDVDALCELLRAPKVVAVGEIGLDYHWEADEAGRKWQVDCFTRQLELANELGYPVIVHDRDAHADTLELLRRYRPQGVVHCFSGSAEMAEELLKLGLYLGVGGVSTFQNAKKIRAVLETLPLDRLLLETDAPYLAPVPYRGTRCHSGMIIRVAEAIAELRATTREEVLARSLENGKRLFRL